MAGNQKRGLGLAWLKRSPTRYAFAAAALLATGAMASPALATVYTLGGDFSNANNPNGVWSITQGTTLLTHYPQPSDGNSLDSAAANGFWGVGGSFNTDVPFVLQTTEDGSATGSFNNNDFLTGDVIAHSPNSGAPLFINWTAPSAGSISFSSAVWYAHSPVTRSNVVSDLLGGSLLNTITVDNTSNRSAPITTLSGSSLAVSAGEVLAFSFAQSPGQTFGSLDGISATVNFSSSAVPEPATWAMMLVGVVGLGAVRRARRRSDRDPAALAF